MPAFSTIMTGEAPVRRPFAALFGVCEQRLLTQLPRDLAVPRPSAGHLRRRPRPRNRRFH